MPAYFRCSFSKFDDYKNDDILGKLSSGYDDDGFYELKSDAITSWREALPLFRNVIRHCCAEFSKSAQWNILLEYPIPRMGKRIDAILICHDILVVVEFKLSPSSSSAAKGQVLDYAYDLRDFHKESWGKRILPIVMAPQLDTETNILLIDSQIHHVLEVDERGLLSALLDIPHHIDPNSEPIDPDSWDHCLYTPTPTIVSAAQHLYAQHSVAEIMRSSAGTDALCRTSETVLNLIDEAYENKSKVVCFVSGVPGSGKTLVGLDIANRASDKTARFMSGNIPLILVLREALARNLHKQGTPKKEANHLMSDRIQNIHHFTKDHFKDEFKRAPEDGNVIIYDEAQRAWNAAQNRRKNKLNHSEPDMILSVLERLDWCVLVAIIGNGQEINTGEAGLQGWKDALDTHLEWNIYIPDATHSLDIYVQDNALNVSSHKDLHLSKSTRSYTAQRMSEWIDAVLDGDAKLACQLQSELSRFPILLTRDLNKAKKWLRDQVAHSYSDRQPRTGLIASSGAKRLRAYGLDPSVQIKETDWFLNDCSDIRSSSFLELAATEYATQGLELDYVGLCWGADFRGTAEGWSYHALSGTKWQSKNNPDNESQSIQRTFMKNTYRVLLSRARDGIVIWVPKGDVEDSTRLPEFYDTTAEYLRSCGVPDLN